MKKLTALIISAIAALVLAACAAQGTVIEKIGLDAAKEKAIRETGLDPSQIVLESIDIKNYDGKEYYEVDLKANGRDYEYFIDALTGVIIASETPNGKTTVSDQTAQPVQTPAATSAPDRENKTFIGTDKAKQLALDHAGLSEADVTFERTELDRDDRRTVYEVDFYTKDRTEYDYEIDAYSGDVLAAEKDMERAMPKQDPADVKNETQTSATISEADAKKLALGQVPGATEADIRGFKTDRDDGRIEYEGKIIYNGMEYEFEIDGHSGAFRSWEAEPVWGD